MYIISQKKRTSCVQYINKYNSINVMDEDVVENLRKKNKKLKKKYNTLDSKFKDLNAKYDKLKNSNIYQGFQPFSFVPLTKDMVINIYPKNYDALAMFKSYIKDYHINKAYPNIFVQNKRNGIFNIYDGETFQSTITKSTIINAITDFAIKIRCIVQATYFQTEYDKIYEMEDEFGTTLKLEGIYTTCNEIISNNQKTIKKFYLEFEQMIVTYHKKIF